MAKTFQELLDACQFVTVEKEGALLHIRNSVNRDNFYIDPEQYDWTELMALEPDSKKFPVWLQELQEFSCPPPAKPAKGQ
jgi:hypothetical protein